MFGRAGHLTASMQLGRSLPGSSLFGSVMVRSLFGIDDAHQLSMHV